MADLSIGFDCRHALEPIEHGQTNLAQNLWDMVIDQYCQACFYRIL